MADLPPKKRQSFENIVLGCLFVGSGYPDFDAVLSHIEQELSVSESILFNGKQIKVVFKPILFIADLIGKSKVLKMKQCNGFYGCTLCTQRGVHYAGAHRYPHGESFTMRSYDSHLVNLSELEKGSIDELKSKYGRNADCEVRTQGVKGRSKILSVIPNQSLSSPIDPMHQLFLGVTKELLGYFYDKMFSSEKKELNKFLNSVLLPKELKNSVRGLDCLSNFKAKELKAFLFYLSPIVLPPFFHGEDRSSDELDLKKLVFATRQLFDTVELSDFCDTLLNQFCRSMADKTERMESINFHLLRHLAWQVKSIGPLFTTSASMFESANRLLIAPLTGTVNQCQLLVRRFIRAKMLAKMNIQDDCLTSSIKDFQENKKFDENYAFLESQETKRFRDKNPSSQLFCCSFVNHFLGSAAYGRGSAADNFVAVKLDNLIVGEILFFYRSETTGCVIRKLEILRKLRLVKTDVANELPFGFLVGDHKEVVEVPMTAIIRKLFRFCFNDSVYLISILKHYEHN